MRNSTKNIALTIALALTFLLTPMQARSQEKTAPEKVRAAIATSSLAFLVPFVAKDRGFYLKYGSDVELIVMRPNIAMAALLGGDIDYAELIGSVIRSAARNLPVRAISTGIKAPFFSVIGQNKFKSVKDLKGAIIGLTSIAGTNHISVRMTLKQFGLDIDKDVKILAIGDERLVYDTFKLGRVDAVALAPPFSV
jgi:ABC-type nitrate/sulfonate/bicarbonate transport system substrate-binding protein